MNQSMQMPEIDLRHPSNVVIETTAHCQLNCAMCARSQVKRRLGHMDPELVRTILTQIAEWNKESIRVWYCFLGEPLLIHNRLMDYIQYGHALGIKHHILNTNGNLLDPSMSERLIAAGLTEIYIGVDAITPETYQEIRVGGDFHRVMRNIHHLLNIKPDDLQVTIQMIELEANRHEEEMFTRYWEQRNARVFVKKALAWIDHVEDSKQRTSSIRRYPCPWILDTFGIYWNGDVPFCVNDWQGIAVYGNARERSLKDLWQEQIKRYGQPHIKKAWNDLPKICKSCRDWLGKAERKIHQKDEMLVDVEAYV